MNRITRVVLGIVGLYFVTTVLIIGYKYLNGYFPKAEQNDILFLLGLLSLFGVISLGIAYTYQRRRKIN